MAEQQFTANAETVAKAFGITQSQAWRMAREKRIPPGTYSYLSEKTLRFDLEALKRWVEKGGVRQAAGSRDRATDLIDHG